MLDRAGPAGRRGVPAARRRARGRGRRRAAGRVRAGRDPRRARGVEGGTRTSTLRALTKVPGRGRRRPTSSTATRSSEVQRGSPRARRPRRREACSSAASAARRRAAAPSSCASAVTRRASRCSVDDEPCRRWCSTRAPASANLAPSFDGAPFDGHDPAHAPALGPRAGPAVLPGRRSRRRACHAAECPAQGDARVRARARDVAAALPDRARRPARHLGLRRDRRRDPLDRGLRRHRARRAAQGWPHVRLSRRATAPGRSRTSPTTFRAAPTRSTRDARAALDLAGASTCSCTTPSSRPTSGRSPILRPRDRRRRDRYLAAAGTCSTSCSPTTDRSARRR